MSEASSSGKHTAGPWVANADHSGEGWRIESDAVGYPNDGWVLAQLSGPDAEANAHLFAAAPELLEALEGLMPTNLGSLPDTMPDSATLPLDVTFGELRAARAALSKAKGEA